MLLGDFNYPNIVWEDTYATGSGNAAESNFCECLRDEGLSQHITLPTRGRLENRSNILDLVITNERGMVDSILHESPLGKSDHCVLIITFICYAELVNTKRMKYYYDKGDYEAMRRKCNSINWDEVLSGDTIDEQWKGLKDTIKMLEEEFIPHRMVGSCNRHKGKIPLDEASVRKIKKKHTLWKRYMETKDGMYYTEFCKARNQVRKMTRKLQKQFEMKLAAEAKSNPKAIWKYINSKTKTRVGVSELNTDPADPTSKLTTSDKEKAEVLGQFFSSVFTTEPDGDIPQIPTINLSNEMEVLVIREENVKEILSGLNSGKSCGPDGIHPRLLQELSDILCTPLTKLFNKSLSLGKLPSEWKEGRISAIFKKGSRKIAGNYRPISLTSIVCKTMEHCVRNHIVNHMMINNLFSNQQYGFIRGRSTVLQMLNVMDVWTKAMDKGDSIDTVYLEISKPVPSVAREVEGLFLAQDPTLSPLKRALTTKGVGSNPFRTQSPSCVVVFTSHTGNGYKIKSARWQHVHKVPKAAVRRQNTERERKWQCVDKPSRTERNIPSYLQVWATLCVGVNDQHPRVTHTWASEIQVNVVPRFVGQWLWRQVGSWCRCCNGADVAGFTAGFHTRLDVRSPDGQPDDHIHAKLRVETGLACCSIAV